jgi:hypothetical protein
MPNALPKNLGGIAPKFWKEVKKKNKLSKDEDLEKNLQKLETEFAGISNPPTSKECESIKKHLMKARVSASKVMQKNKQDLVVTFCETVLEWTTRYESVVVDALAAADIRDKDAAGDVISANIFSLAASKFPDNKAVKAFVTDKAFTLFILEGQKPVKDAELAQCQAEVKTRLANLKKLYAALGKLSKVKNAKPAELVRKVKEIYEGIGDQLAPVEGIHSQIRIWFGRVDTLYGSENKAQYLKYQKTPVWQIAQLAAATANKEFDADYRNSLLVDEL